MYSRAQFITQIKKNIQPSTFHRVASEKYTQEISVYNQISENILWGKWYFGKKILWKIYSHKPPKSDLNLI